MIYEGPRDMTDQEIEAVLSDSAADARRRIEAVLSAIYYGECEWAGDVLIKEFSRADEDERISLCSLSGTYYLMRKTTYRIRESLALAKAFHKTVNKQIPYAEGTVQDCIEELEHCMKIFGKK